MIRFNYVTIFFIDLEYSIPEGPLVIERLISHVKAIVSSYPTVECFERGYEAHQHVIDIQFPIVGLERVKWSPIDNMDVNIPYDEVKDRTFYKNPDPVVGTEITIGNGFFGIMFLQDGHSPQHLVGKSEVIKKITIKVAI